MGKKEESIKCIDHYSDVVILLPESIRGHAVNLQQDVVREKNDRLEQILVDGFKPIALQHTAGQLRRIFHGLDQMQSISRKCPQYTEELSVLEDHQGIIADGGPYEQSFSAINQAYNNLKTIVQRSPAPVRFSDGIKFYDETLAQCSPAANTREFHLPTPGARLKYSVPDLCYGGRSGGKNGQNQWDLVENTVEMPAAGYIHVLGKDAPIAQQMVARLKAETGAVDKKYVTICNWPTERFFKVHEMFNYVLKKGA